MQTITLNYRFYGLIMITFCRRKDRKNPFKNSYKIYFCQQTQQSFTRVQQIATRK